MSRRSWKQWFLQQIRLTRRSTKPRRAPRGLAFETLDQRITPAVNAFFGHGVLTIVGDNLNNTIDVSRDATGKLLVNGGAVSIRGAGSTVANTRLIHVMGLGGNDSISLNEANGALPKANLFGGNGNDTLTGGSAGDRLLGQAGNDTLLGKGGVDILFGGAGNDALTGGAGDDQALGQAGNDRLIWNPGEGSDLNEGGAGSDIVEVIGGIGAETFTIAASGTRVRFDRTTPAPFFLDIGTSENLVLSAVGGDDVISAGNGLAGLIQLTLDGGAGNDTINGGDGNDRLVGGDGNDFIDGNGGSDTAFMGAGDDTFQWDPGDGSDIVEGQEGSDRMIFNGANGGESVDISASGERVRFFRNPGNITMDLNDVERVDFNALGGQDTTTVNDLTGTDLTEVNINLQASAGGGDLLADAVIVNGTNGPDNINVVGQGTSVSVVGLAARVNITNSDGTLDLLTVKTLGGNDVVDSSGLPANLIGLTVDLGDGQAANPAVTASFSAAGGLLRVVGDDSDNAIVISRDAAGTILVNNGAVAIQGDPGATVANTQQILINGGAGNDNLSLSEANGAMPAAGIFGQAGNDVLTGGSGVDFIDGGTGSDTAFLGAGDDTFQWNPGDGSDTVEGQAGKDTMVFNGSDLAENFDISDSGNGLPFHRVRFTRDIGNVTMDLSGLEDINLNALGGIDNITVHDLSGTDATAVNLDLIPGSGAGDGQTDTVIVEGTAGNDNVEVTGSGASFTVTGLSAVVTTTGSEGAKDQLVIKGLGGDDTLSAATLSAGVVSNLTSDGGVGNDIIRGSQGVDFLFGGDGNDFIDGNQGADSASLGAGNDTFQWDPGDASDKVEGDGGSDKMIFNGSNAPSENIDISANGNRVRFFRDAGNITMDLDGVEQIDFNALGGADSITINDQLATDLSVVNVNLSGSAGGGDGEVDAVIMNGTAGNDNFQVASFDNGNRVAVASLFPFVSITGAEAANDRLTVNTLGGDDAVDALSLAASIQLKLDGGEGNDDLSGGLGNDTVIGGAGDDILRGAEGNDTLTGDDGDDVLIGGSGIDALDGGSGNNTLIQD